MAKPNGRLRPQEGDFTRAELQDRWGRSKNTLENWIHRQKILRPKPSSRGQGCGLLFSKKEVNRFESKYGIRPRKK